MSKESFQLFRGMLIGANKVLALKALTIAEEVHKGVMRKDGITPYIEHPVKVASLLFELGIQEDNILAIAILHDVLEDCKDEDREILRKRLYKTFDINVLFTVDRLSKSKDYNNDSYYSEIKKDPIAVLVKLADRTHNLSTLFNFSEEKKNKYIKETKEFIYPLIHYAQHTYYEFSYQLRMFDLWIESIVKNIEPYLKEE